MHNFFFVKLLLFFNLDPNSSMKPSKKDEKGSSSIESVEGLAVSYIYMFEMNIVKNEIN